ncbi:hypothetical protein SDC9_80822 [bioreactor metagenome]|uniref:Uncharacterized protein n=1 Tax=bioreactor metagenome TaxID=1076179 RepID=A0A644Z045_9ZZZZ
MQLLVDGRRKHRQQHRHQQREIAVLDGIGAARGAPFAQPVHLPDGDGARAQATDNQPPDKRPWPGRIHRRIQQARYGQDEFGGPVPLPHALGGVGQGHPQQRHGEHAGRPPERE